MMILIFAVILILTISFTFGKTPKRLNEPKDSDHFKGGQFYIPWDKSPETSKSLKALLKWRLNARNTAWKQDAPTDYVEFCIPPRQKTNYIQHINHASSLIDLNGTRFLIDPQFAERVGPVSFLGPKRRHPLPFQMEDIGKLDVILLTHNHYDHMNLASLKKLQQLYSPHFIVAHSNGPYLLDIGVKKTQITELDWWESTNFSNVTVSLAPAQHWSKRRLFDRNFALWGAFVLENDSKKIFLAGDTGFASHFHDIQARWNSFDVSLLPVGAYEPRWFMKFQHMNPEEAVQAHKILKSKKSIGIHHSSFQLTDEAWNAPFLALQESLKKENISENDFIYPKAGQIFEI